MKFRLFAGLFLILSLAAILLVGCHGDVTSGDCNTHNLEYRAAVEATCTDAGTAKGCVSVAQSTTKQIAILKGCRLWMFSSLQHPPTSTTIR